MEEKNIEENEKKSHKIKIIRHTIVVYLTIAVATMAAVTLLYSTVLVNAYIPSESMERTLMVGDRIIGNRLAYKFGHNPERYDIVIFYAPDEPDEPYIKRIIGLPGEKVTIRDCKVYINDSSEPLDDSFLPEDMEEDEEMEFNVPENCYFMMGDNRNYSNDSRYWDNPYVSRDSIIAKASFKYWKGFKIL